jgi:hypothetical protein
VPQFRDGREPPHAQWPGDRILADDAEIALDGGEDSDIDIDRAVHKAAVIGGLTCAFLVLAALGYYLVELAPALEVMALARPS